MAKLIACGPLSEETEEALSLGYKGGMLQDFVRTNDFAVQLQESNRQLRARIAALEAENTALLEDAARLGNQLQAADSERRAAVLAEREACAKVADEYGRASIGDAIRARKGAAK